MRSLTLTQASVVPICEPGCSRAAALAVDPEKGMVYAASERKGEFGVEVDIISIAPSEFEESGQHRRQVIASFSSPVAAPFSLPEYRSEVLDVHYLADDRSLVILLAGGDIATLPLESLDGGVGAVEIVGSMDSGIKVAAWSPDEEQLILVTGEDNIVCMTRTFDVIHEEPLRQDDFGEDKMINVGWGSKSTQFHGSLGKAAAKQPVASSSSASPTSWSHPTDDGLPVITFRGDGAYFAISSLDAYSSSSLARRQIRIYSRDPSAGFVPKLSATSEYLPGLEGALSWRPSGNLMSGIVRYGHEGGATGREGKWDIAMIERNGLRHGGFELREEPRTWQDGRIRGIKWNADSEVLAIWIERVDRDVVQLWTMKNYHYYLKQEIYSQESSAVRFRGMYWHPEEPFKIYIVGQRSLQARTYVWDTYSSRLSIPQDTATVAVVDGSHLLLTPFRTQNTPPPMSSYQIPLPAQAVHVAFSPTSDALTVLLADGSVQLWDLNTRLPGPEGSRLRGGGKVAEPALRWHGKIGADEGVLKQACLDDEGRVAVLLGGQSDDSGKILRLEAGDVVGRFEMDHEAERILWDQGARVWLVMDNQGVIMQLPNLEIVVTLCPRPEAVAISHESSLIIALSPLGKLLAASTVHTGPVTSIASAVTSFVLAPDFLIYTTSAQQSHYAPLSVLQQMAAGEDVAPSERDWETRTVERGSLLVVACPSEMSLVMQMPRGNLETVYPRPLVLAVVRREVLAGNYRSAFTLCRKHRLDLNILHDLDPAGFMAKLSDFADQIPEVDYLNLFVSSLSGGDSSGGLYRDLAKTSRKGFPLEKVNRICDALRILLETRDAVKYVETILTTHVCKQPADYESGLQLLHRLQSDHADIVEDAIKYIIFLSDVNKLYDVALGMYDFKLVLMVAQYSQKDPKEYLPFLRELRALDKHEQRFRIDDYLERRGSALRNLAEAGPSRWADASSYMARYELFDHGFKLYAGDDEKLPVIHGLYGDYLYDRREFMDSAISYSLARLPQKALKAYEKAHAWRELFTLAQQTELPKEVIAGICARVSDHLASRGRSIEASRVLVEYGDDVDSAVDVLCRAAEFGEAMRLVSARKRKDLVESLVHPGLDTAQEGFVEVFEEMEGQLDKEVKRLQDLQRIRRDDPDTFYLVDNEPDLEGVDVATNATTAVTNFTRYTVAPTVFSQSTRITGQTNRTKHKPSRKRAAGRKGTVDEYDYLLMSLGRLIIRVDEKAEEAIPILRHLMLATSDHRDSAKVLQNTIIAFRSKLKIALVDAWKDRDAILQEAEDSGGLVFGGDEAKLREVRAAVRPEMKEWKGLGMLAQ